MSKLPLRVCLIGSRGRMGQTIAAVAARDPGIVISAEVDYGDSIGDGLESCDVAIDFSVADAAQEICRIAVQKRRPLIVGTTGHSPDQKGSIEMAAASLPIVFASNFSVGVNALFWLSGRAAKLLGTTFRAEIVETHHRMKKDAPSGTAKTLAEILRKEQGRADIPIQSIREGEVVGEHNVIFTGPGERLELIHRAESRETFAGGALTAAKWVINQAPGVYSMQDVLGLT